MTIWNKLKSMFSKEEKTIEEREKALEPFRRKYHLFQDLLANNNAVLEAMADMEEKLSGEYLFDRRYLETKVGIVSDGVRKIIEDLNGVARRRYTALAPKYDEITSAIQSILSTKTGIAESSFTIPFSEIGRAMADRVGSKVANLGEIRNRVGLPVPEGFGVSAYAFKRFMDHNGFHERITEKLSSLSLSDMESLRKTSQDIQGLITSAEVPEDLAGSIRDAYAELCSLVRETVPVSVRSSALQEDGEFSFAGQYSTFLNVSEEMLQHKYKEVVASLFNERALFYYKTKGFQEHEMAMPVGILQMIDAKAGGVIYSRDPNDCRSDDVIISAIRGLGVCVVDGTVTPEVYRVSRKNGGVIEKSLPAQQSMAVCRADGGLDRIAVDAEALASPCLTDSEIQALGSYALALERHFGAPQDIEWAIDRQDRPFILQSRPLRITAKEPAKAVPTRVKGYNLLIEKGAIACKGIGFGKAHVVRTDEDLADFPDGGVLIAKHTSTKFVTVMNKASAIITDVGATTGHMASLAREFQVPTILDAEKATSLIANGQELTVDAVNCNVYEGTVDELREFAEKKEEPFKETHIFKILEKTLKLIVPLNLVDPVADNFRADACSTLHDITRFCHEKVMDELFDVVDTSADDVGAVKLVAGIPTEIYLLDLGGGVERAPKYLNPEHLRSIPFNAFLKGLTSMKWPEPRAFDVQGFLGAVAHTATVSEEELQKTAEKSFAFVSSHYMNFAIRLGYHLSTVEAYAGESINDNYIKFFFKGGGAVIDRRLRRVRLIREILKCMDFNVKSTDDVLEASLMKYKEDTILQKLETMGRFTVYTKQLDMVMYNDMITDHYIEEFCKQYVKKEG